MSSDVLFNEILEIIGLGPEVRQELETLSVLIKETESSVLAFALYQGEANREAASTALKERLQLPVTELFLSPYQQNPLKLLIEEVSSKERGCVFFFGIEDALPEVSGYVNLQREGFGEVRHAMVFWVTEYGLREIAALAPDFWAWRSGVFDMRANRTAPIEEAVQSALLLPVNIGNLRKEEIEKHLHLYDGLLREYGSQEHANDSFLSGLNIRVASYLINLGKLSKAAKHLKIAIEESRRAGDHGREAKALTLLAHIFSDQKEYDVAEKMLLQALTITKESKLIENIPIIHTILGLIAASQGQYNKAKEYYLNALKESEALNLKNEVASALNYLGMLDLRSGNSIESEEWLRRSLKIQEELEFQEDLAATLSNLGVVLKQQGRLEESEKYLRRSLQVLKQLGSESGSAATWNQLGIVLEQKESLKEAEQCFREAIKISEQFGLEVNSTFAWNQLGIVLQKQERPSEAEMCFHHAIEISERLGLQVNKAKAYTQLGIMLHQQGRLKEAEESILDAISILEGLNIPPELFNNLAQLGKILTEEKRFEEAIKTNEKAIAIFVELTAKTALLSATVKIDLKKTKELLAETYKQIGEENFVRAWYKGAPGIEPPLAELKELLSTKEKD